MENTEVYVITGDRAVERFLESKDTWNAYVEEYPHANVDFSNVDFSKDRSYKESFNFRGYKFPLKSHVFFGGAQFGKGDVIFDGTQFGEGNVFFNETQFGEGNVSFDGTQFGEGNVFFNETQFGEGNVSFDDTQFGEGNVSFGGVQFGKGNVYFYDAQFGNGEIVFLGAKFGEGDVYLDGAQFKEGTVSFRNVQFGEGEVSFNETQFGEGNVSFDGTQFGEGNVFFGGAQFGEGNVSFGGAQFGEGNVSFDDTQFGEGNVSFGGAQFGEGAVSFNEVAFGKGEVSFEYATFLGHLSFNKLSSPKLLNKFSLRNTSFGKTLDLSGNTFNCIPDLTNTKLTNQVSLDRLVCDFKLTNGNPDPTDAERLCRLKEISESNKNHQQSLMFHAQEMRVKRYGLPFYSSWLDASFDFISRYGQSVARPSCYLGIVTLLYAFVYFVISNIRVNNTVVFEWNTITVNSILYSLGQVFPFVASGRQSAKASAEELFTADIPAWIYGLSHSQGLVSFVLLFLIGLGIRNRFRL